MIGIGNIIICSIRICIYLFRRCPMRHPTLKNNTVVICQGEKNLMLSRMKSITTEIEKTNVSLQYFINQDIMTSNPKVFFFFWRGKELDKCALFLLSPAETQPRFIIFIICFFSKPWCTHLYSGCWQARCLPYY
jgi:hypothetical protein